MLDLKLTTQLCYIVHRAPKLMIDLKVLPFRLLKHGIKFFGNLCKTFTLLSHLHGQVCSNLLFIPLNLKLNSFNFDFQLIDISIKKLTSSIFVSSQSASA